MTSSLALSLPEFKQLDHPLWEQIRFGLSLPQKTLPPALFYDERGSDLFDRICRTLEYYPFRTELSILLKRADEIADLLGPSPVLIEPGSGMSRKIRILLDKITMPAVYVPVEISEVPLKIASMLLPAEYPGLTVHPVCADFLQEFRLPPLESASTQGSRAIFFPGSTLGNLEPSAAARFLSRMAKLAGPSGYVILGVDLVKEKPVLDAAYNDAQGVTREFNLNMLRRLRDELGAELDLSGFEHEAFFNERESRIEMHLKSLRDQRIRFEDIAFSFRRGETIHTESSYKYSKEGIEKLALRAGLQLSRFWTDPEKLFSVSMLKTRLSIQT